MHRAVVGRTAGIGIREKQRVATAAAIAQPDARKFRLAAVIVLVQVDEKCQDALPMQFEFASERGSRRFLEVGVKAELLARLVAQAISSLRRIACPPRYRPRCGPRIRLSTRSAFQEREIRFGIGAGLGLGTSRRVATIDLRSAHAVRPRGQSASHIRQRSRTTSMSADPRRIGQDLCEPLRRAPVDCDIHLCGVNVPQSPPESRARGSCSSSREGNHPSSAARCR